MAYDNQGAAVGAAGHYASAITAALITSGVIDTEEGALDSFRALLPEVFAACEELKGTLPEAEAPARASRGRAPARGRSGGRSSGGGSQTAPGDTDFRGGKFAGKTIAEVYALDNDDEDGPGYLDWCVANLKNDFMVSRIEAFLQTV